MKLLLILAAFSVVISAIPADLFVRHGLHSHSSVAVARPAATTSVRQPNGGSGRDSNREGNRNGNQRGTSAGGSPAVTQQTTARVLATTARASAQATTTTASVGQGANTGNNVQNANKGSINPDLVPDFGQQAGLKPDGTGNCKADSGKTIPCQCPPTRAAFIAKLSEFVSAGSFFGRLAAPFPTGSSNQEALTRIDTIISALQNFDGKPGVGCPSVSAPNFSVVQQRLLKGG